MKHWATSIPGAVLLCTFALYLQPAAAVSSASQNSQTQQPSAQAGPPPATQPNAAQQTAPPSGGQQAQQNPAQQMHQANAGQQVQQKPVPKKSPKKTPPPAKPGNYFEARVKLPHGSPLTPAQIVTALKMPLPFYLEPSALPAPDGSILIYCKAESLDKCDSDLLQKLKSDIVALAGDSKTDFIRIEHAKYLPDIVKQAQALNYDGITVEAAGPNSMKVTRTAAVSPEQYAKFKAALDELFWKFKPQAPASRVYYLNASDAATALGAGGAAKNDKSGGSGSSGASATVTVQNLAASNVGPCPASGTPPAGGGAKGAKAAPGANKSAKSKSDSGAASDGSGGDDAAKSSDGDSVTGCPPAASAASASDSGKMSKDSSKSALSVSPVNGDVLVFSPEATAADDDAIAQSKRVLALIDFPRPEVLINTLSFQASSSDPKALAENDQVLQSRIGSYNDSLQLAMARAWTYLQQQMQSGTFFDRPFYDYLTKRFVADSSYSDAANELILKSDVRTRPDYNLCGPNRYCLGYTSLFHPLRPSLTDMLFAVISSGNPSYQFRTAIGEMQGFSYSANPPGFKESGSQGKKANTDRSCGKPGPCTPPATGSAKTCDQRDAEVWRWMGNGVSSSATTGQAAVDAQAMAQIEQRREALNQLVTRAIVSTRSTWNALSSQLLSDEQKSQDIKHIDGILAKLQTTTGRCVLCPEQVNGIQELSAALAHLQNRLSDRDQQITIAELQKTLDSLTQQSKTTLDEMVAAQAAQDKVIASESRGPYFPMYCFQEAIEVAFPPEAGAVNQYSANNLGKPLRAALANFLFQYKMSQQFPQEFSAYELGQTAQELNSELNPLIVAFNRDVAAALVPIQEFAKCQLKGDGWGGWAGHGTRFLNNGIITVRTVSGKETVVDTETQSFFDVTNPPSITDVINSVGQAQSNVPNVLKTNLTANEAAVIIGALNSVQPTTSQVGRVFKLDITPHSLSGASSAELDVNITTGEPAAPTRYAGGKSSNDNISRISKNNINTKVRLESIKLFEISSFTAVVQQSRHNFPLLPPFVEIPYIGSFLSFPVPGAKEYHRSTTVMSAVVVPTAADLASGVVFSYDGILRPSKPEERGRKICGPIRNGDGQFCSVTRALSLYDFGAISIAQFNRRMASCFSAPDSLAGPCDAITFDSILPGE